MLFLKEISRQQIAVLVALLSLLGFVHAAQASQDHLPPQASAVLLQKLTADERAWLRAHPVIRVVQDPGWPPIEFADAKGEPSGMANDYLDLMERMLGVKFQRIRGLSWQEAYARLKRWDIDMTTSVAVTPEREIFWAFTRPYMKIPIVIVTHADVTYIADIRELDGKKVAVVDGYAVTDWIPRDYPAIQLVRVQNAQEGLKTLQRGEVFAFIENMLVVGYYMASLKLANLKIAGETPYINAQSMAVRKDWAPLAGILQKALDSISETQRTDIYRRWLPVRYEHGFDYTPLWYALAAFVLILLGMAAWNWKLFREIGYRKKAEIALLRSEQKFRLVFETANAGKSITLPTGEIDVNQALCLMLGYEKDELVGKKWQDITPQEDIADIQSMLDPLLQGRKDSTRFEKRYIHKNGTIVWADVSVAILRDARNTPLFFITTIIDITDRRNTRQALMERDALFTKLTSGVPGMIYQFERRPEGTYRVPYTSKGIEDIFGCTPEAVRDTFDPIFTAIFPGDRARLMQTIEESANGLTPWRCEYRVQIPGRELRWMLGQSVPEQMPGGSIVWSGYNTDITRLKEAEAAVKESEDVFLKLFMHHSAVKLLIDPETGAILDANEAAENFYGWTRDELLRMRISDINTLPPRAVKDTIDKIINQEKFRFEFQHRLADGSIRDVEVFSAIIDIKGKSVLHSIVADITDRKNAEAALCRLNEELEQKVAGRTAELTRIIAQLEETNRVFVGRELKMADLKKRIEELEKIKDVSRSS